MLTKEERQQLKEQEREYKKQAKQRREELKNQKVEEQRKKKEHKNFFKKDKNKKQKTNSIIQKKTLAVFPIRDYENDYFITDDNQIIDIFEFQGRCYYDASDDEIDSLVYSITKFLRKYSADMKLISMNYPTNTKLQQSFLTNKLQQTELRKYEDIINQKLAVLQDLEKTTTDREAFIMIFANNENHYKNLAQLLFNNNYFNIKSIDCEKKENIIFQLNNMNKNVKI